MSFFKVFVSFLTDSKQKWKNEKKYNFRWIPTKKKEKNWWTVYIFSFINPISFFRYLNSIKFKFQLWYHSFALKSKSLPKLCIITFDALSAKLIGSLFRRQPKFFIEHSESIVLFQKQSENWMMYYMINSCWFLKDCDYDSAAAVNRFV